VSAASDLDSIRALFNEKEKELSLAVAKVEELTHQLEELKRGRGASARDQQQQSPSPAALELDKLRRELMVCFTIQFSCFIYFFSKMDLPAPGCSFDRYNNMTYQWSPAYANSCYYKLSFLFCNFYVENKSLELTTIIQFYR
jgi:hypothetical protein